MFRANDEHALEIDFGAVDFSTPSLALSSSIGNGLGFISKLMASRLSGGLETARPLLEYLLNLNYQGQVRGLTTNGYVCPSVLM